MSVFKLQRKYPQLQQQELVSQYLSIYDAGKWRGGSSGEGAEVQWAARTDNVTFETVHTR